VAGVAGSDGTGAGADVWFDVFWDMLARRFRVGDVEAAAAEAARFERVELGAGPGLL
jgi:hypothetical protein